VSAWIRRRELLSLGTAGTLVLAAAPFAARAQVPKHRHLVGYLAGGFATTGSAAALLQERFLEAMAERGWINGRDFDLVSRFAENQFDRIPELARQIVAQAPEVIVAGTTQPLVELSRLTTTIPLVFASGIDPVPLGLVVSHNRPGRNVTGIMSALDDGFAPKQLEMGHELMPAATRIGVLVNPTNPSHALYFKGAERAATALRLIIVPAEVRTPDDLEGAFARFAAERVQLVQALADNLTFIQATRVAKLAEAARLPVIGAFREQAEAGFVMTYGVNLAANFRRAGQMTDRILRGSKPADLPVEFPTLFDVILNLKMAKLLGLTAPPTILIRATEFIE
jgi:putative tryptophan/tyrosine transport system substrate-binding protein